MAHRENVFSDNEYTIMAEIVGNENITQRELSKKLGISVSTVNVLMNKMIKEGLVKMTQMTQKQVFYILTPVGMLEKAKKTVSYLKAHYRAIYEMKEKIKSIFEVLTQEHDAVFVLLCEDEMSEIIGVTVEEFQSDNDKSSVRILKNKNDIINFKSPVLVYMTVDEEVLKEYSDIGELRVIDLGERL